MSSAAPSIQTPFPTATAAHEQETQFVVTNMVCTVNLGMPLDLPEIAQKARNTEYNPKRFAAVIMRLRDPKATALIFSSGKLVVTGAKTTDSALTAGRKFARVIQRINPSYNDVSFKDFKIQNMVATADMRFPIRLERLFDETKGGLALYEPELFPGLVYKMISPKVVLLIFVSGKVVLTGAKNIEDIGRAFKHITPILRQHRKEVS
eukprot:ANDGO_04950.mRNA.1 hypothetical protein